MKPDWEELGEAFANNKKVLIGDVDCTADSGKSLCEEYKVEGYPTLKYMSPPTYEAENYEGDRSLKALKKFAKSLRPACTAKTWSTCSKKQKAELQPYIDMEPETLNKDLAKLKSELDAATEEHKTLLDQLQASYKAAEAKLKEIKETHEPKIKLMKAAATKSLDAESPEEKAEL